MSGGCPQKLAFFHFNILKPYMELEGIKSPLSAERWLYIVVQFVSDGIILYLYATEILRGLMLLNTVHHPCHNMVAFPNSMIMFILCEVKGLLTPDLQ